MLDQCQQKRQSYESGHAVDHEKKQKFFLSQLSQKIPSQSVKQRRRPLLDPLTLLALPHLRQQPENNRSDLIVVRILACRYRD